jgi:hypothetical protein
MDEDDTTLSMLCKKFIYRKLLKIEMQNEPFNNDRISNYKTKIARLYQISETEAAYFVFADTAANHAYSAEDDRINILFKGGELKDISDASDMLNLQVLSKNVTKNFFCYPVECRL